MKIQTKEDGCYMNISMKCGFGEKILVEDLDMFASKSVMGFLKVKERDKKKVTYSGIKGISLKERLKKPMSQYDFFFILEQFLISIEKARGAGILLKNIIYEMDQVFITDTTNELQLIYLPLDDKQPSKFPLDFVETFIYSALSVQNNKTISDFALYLKKQAGFNADAIELYINNVEPKIMKVLKDDEYIAVSSEDSVRHSEDKKPVVLENGRCRNTEDEKGTVIGNRRDQKAEDEKGTVIGSGRDRSSEDEEATVIGDDDGTVLVSYEETPSVIPYLIQKSTNEIIKINQSFFRFGSKEGVVDYRIQNNTVSRMHADIIIKKQRCFVIDLESKNRTYVNGRPIPSKVEVEIFDGDIISFSNEEFEFYM